MEESKQVFQPGDIVRCIRDTNQLGSPVEQLRLGALYTVVHVDHREGEQLVYLKNNPGRARIDRRFVLVQRQPLVVMDQGEEYDEIMAGQKAYEDLS